MRFPPSHPLHLVAGLTIWSIWFVILYSGVSLFCDGPNKSLVIGAFNPLNIALMTGTLIVSAGLFYAARRCWRAGPESRIAAGLYVSAAIATFAVGAPIIYLPPCL